MQSDPTPILPVTPANAQRQSLFRLSLTAEIFVAATPQRVWQVLTDFGAYQQWNPSIPMASGQAIAGSILHVEIHWPGLKRGRYRLTVLAAVSQRELRWLGHFGVAGLMDGDHRFLVEGLAPGLTKVTQQEQFSGLLVPVFAPWLRDNVLRGFVQMNQAIRTAAEPRPGNRTGC